MSVKQLRKWVKLLEDDRPGHRYVLNLWDWAKQEPRRPKGISKVRAQLLRLHLRALLLEK